MIFIIARIHLSYLTLQLLYCYLGIIRASNEFHLHMHLLWLVVNNNSCCSSSLRSMNSLQVDPSVSECNIKSLFVVVVVILHVLTNT